LNFGLDRSDLLQSPSPSALHDLVDPTLADLHTIQTLESLLGTNVTHMLFLPIVDYHTLQAHTERAVHFQSDRRLTNLFLPTTVEAQYSSLLQTAFKPVGAIFGNKVCYGSTCPDQLMFFLKTIKFFTGQRLVAKLCARLIRLRKAQKRLKVLFAPSIYSCHSNSRVLLREISLFGKLDISFKFRIHPLGPL
jgi:hypothetical protein